MKIETKGKNFSCNNNGKRKKSDFYETPYSITEHLLNMEKFNGVILEPACGNGAIVKVLIIKGKKVIFYDREVDFFKETKTYKYIVTNPPFSLSYNFICKAKQIAKEKFCFLLPLSYLHGKKRFDFIYSDKKFPLARVYIFTRSPLLGEKIRDDGKYNTGMMVYAWFVWVRGHCSEPIIRWINNNKDLLGKVE